ncbi:MAG: ribonuclease HII [Candidatus Saccharimonadales bacterium]
MILGIDEVGRGSWAGPLVIGAVILDGTKIQNLNDSKKLSKRLREQLDLEIRSKARAYGLGWVSPQEIDEMGLSKALTIASLRAIENINLPYDEIIIDGNVNFLKDTAKSSIVTTIKKADELIPSVSAASIIAKVARDEYMKMQHKKYVNYGFNNHVGYGTKNHINSIKKYGVTPLHRLSIKPLQKYKSSDIKNTTSIGQTAEDIASKFLIDKGHRIIDRNWRNKYCEIDIVSKIDNKLYFNEVKYRKDSSRGGGIDAVDKRKLNKMRFAAEIYVNSNKIKCDTLGLTVISVSGLKPSVDEWLEV